jgi:photosystem II stability/assembly factor-like uncharacterized protein
MRSFLLVPALALAVHAQPVLFATANFSSTYIVGGKVAPSGVFRRGPDGAWQHAGYNLPILTTLAGDSNSVLIAGGNGLIRAVHGGADWTLLTGSDVTELRDVLIDNDSIYFTHTRGIRVSRDGGNTWTELASGLRRKFVETVRIVNGALIAGTEDGIRRSDDGGKTWQLAGAAGQQILRLESSPDNRCVLLASTQGGGIFASTDCGRTFENASRLGVGHNIYDLAFDPAKPGRVAAGGFGPGVAVSTDNGKTWTSRNTGLPSTDVTAVVFDPAQAGRLFAAVHETGLFVSDDAGVTWRSDGMENSHITCLRFLPEVKK